MWVLTAPLLEIWAGTVFGARIPLGAWMLAWKLRWPLLFLRNVFARFCLAANGVFLFGGTFAQGADQRDVMRQEGPRWAWIFVGLIVEVAGLIVWHNQGSHLGLGKSRGGVSAREVGASVVLLMSTVTIEVICGSR